jgi:hypothetical protein
VDSIAAGDPGSAAAAMTAVIFNGMKRHGASPVDPTLLDPALALGNGDKDRT